MRFYRIRHNTNLLWISVLFVSLFCFCFRSEITAQSAGTNSNSSISKTSTDSDLPIAAPQAKLNTTASLSTVPALPNSPTETIEKKVKPPGKYGSYLWPVVGYEAITGTFGEYRSSHFHMGMDFSTGGRRGLPIISVSKGKVVEIQRFWSSIGNSVIVEHEDGIRARYGHLSKFSPKLVKFLKSSSSAKDFKSRRDFKHELGEPIPVEAGELIAYSGDTGIGPPHLHFELFRNGIYFNPRDFGLGHTDGEDVVLDFVTIRPETPRTFINGKHEPLTIKFEKTEGGYIANSDHQEILIQGIVSFQVSGHQKSRTNRLGLQSISLIVNGKENLNLNFQSLPKAQTKKFVLVYDSYKSKSNGNPFLYNLFSRQGFGIPGLGNTMVGSGLISSGNFNHNSINQISILAGGLGENRTEGFLNVKKDTSDYSHIQTPSYTFNVSYDRYTNLSSTDRLVELFFPANSVFGKANFQIEEINDFVWSHPGLSLESKMYKISPEDFREFNLGFDLYFKIGHKADLNQAGIYEIKSNGVAIPVKKANFSTWGRFFKARLKKTGIYAVLVDKISPQLELMGNLKSGHIFPNQDFEIEWKLKDFGSGIDQNSIQVKVDGELAIAELNPRTGVAIVVEPENIFAPGKHRMEAVGFDRAGNKSESIVFDYIVKGTKLANLTEIQTSKEIPTIQSPGEAKTSTARSKPTQATNKIIK
ncbi:M23 family metallopeptidase [Leptospira sp. GIMC2001]|uniref:M23 family metallopeptidase n=1 Tax=Leptospira sp. GIMC2001 TaxID=1513297 RepID=UPI00234B4586|nr:M23 family metallopeptidase [Leptospira sp. GIMC2001]WCL49458.1 M23 family metallopeptidase [Leptospira sp. GIMC2001]